jgi:glycosyltransferase involved in cell wall biosynthesis
VSELYLSVVVPCYNESENLHHGVLEEMQRYLADQDFTYEVLISDDGSSDDSRDVVRAHLSDKPRFRLLENAHGGKPWAVWHGIQAAQGEIILFTDMDQSAPLDQFALLRPWFAKGYNVVIGSRGLERQDFPFYRRLGSTLFRAFRQLFLLRDISDTQCGFKAMRRDVARQVFPLLDALHRTGQVKGWKVTAFDVELLFLAQRAGHRIAEVGVAWANRDIAVRKGKSYFAESREMAMQLLRIKLNAWRGVYEQREAARD